jgi:hypothetical protein
MLINVLINLNMLEELLDNSKSPDSIPSPDFIDDAFNGIPFGKIDEYMSVLNVLFIVIIFIAFKYYIKKNT